MPSSYNAHPVVDSEKHKHSLELYMRRRHPLADAAEKHGAKSPHARRRGELVIFFVLAFGIWPLVAFGVVGAYGFLVWMWQLVFGPPGPPTLH
jgi:periplasmic nitrate reductase NapE